MALWDNITPLKVEDVTEIERIMEAFVCSESSKTLSSLLRKKELLYRLFGCVAQAFVDGLPSVRRGMYIEEGVRLLEETYLENLPVKVFAEASRMSLTLFRCRFRERYGMSPVSYRNKLRIERAKELLSDGTLTVSEVAYACGFENLGYFSRYFLKMTGKKPKEYQNK